MVYQVSYELSASSPSESRHHSPVKGTDSKDSLQLEGKLLLQLLNDLHEESAVLNSDYLVFLEFLLGSLTSIIS